MRAKQPIYDITKAALPAEYVNGLPIQGGPSSDAFKKSLGEKAAKLFKTVLFETEK